MTHDFLIGGKRQIAIRLNVWDQFLQRNKASLEDQTRDPWISNQKLFLLSKEGDKSMFQMLSVWTLYNNWTKCSIKINFFQIIIHILNGVTCFSLKAINQSLNVIHLLSFPAPHPILHARHKIINFTTNSFEFFLIITKFAYLPPHIDFSASVTLDHQTVRPTMA
jgi:hypothetical protein